VYTDRQGIMHKLAWYEVISFCEMPSPVQRMNGIGVCAISRVLRMAQVMKSASIFMDEMISGKNVKKINIVGGVSRTDINDVIKRIQTDSDNKGNIRFIEHAILASLDPEKPVSSTEVNLAEFPPDFSFDIFMKWYISTLALGFAVDYQEFAPLPGGNIGSGAQSDVLNSKSNAKGPAAYMQMNVKAYKNYGVLPRYCTMEYEAINQSEELNKQNVRTKALEEAALSSRNGIMPPKNIREDLVRRGIYDKETIAGIPDDYGIDLSATTIREQAIPNPDGNPQAPPTPVGAGKQKFGQTGGNTLLQDAKRTPTGKQNQTVGNRLAKAIKALRGEDDN
jgi:hypothetical protein